MMELDESDSGALCDFFFIRIGVVSSLAPFVRVFTLPVLNGSSKKWKVS